MTMKPNQNVFQFPRIQVNNREVSLVEIALCCGIVLIALTLLLPTVSASVSSNKNQQCVYNLKQLHMATALYLQDYDETLPLAWKLTKEGDQEQFTSWRDTLSAYLRSKAQGKASSSNPDFNSVFHCPADKHAPASVSYALNALITGYSGLGGESRSSTMASIAHPEQIVFLGDTNKNWRRGEGFYDTIADWVRPEMDLGVANTDNRAVRFYYRWLKERDWTDLTATGLDCPDGVYRCKYPSFHHERTGNKTGYTHFLMVDGHLGIFRWGQANVENFFPNLTTEQFAQTRTEGE